MTSGESSASHKIAQRVDDIAQFEHFAQELRRLGHTVAIISKPGRDVRQVVLNAAKRDHSYAKTGTPFKVEEVPGLQETLDGIEDDASYYYGFVLIYAWAKHMLTNGVYCGAYDFAHAEYGTMASLSMVNGNRNIIPMLHAHFADNENTATSDTVLREAKASCPELNSGSITIIRDGSSALEGTLTKHLNYVHQFSCFKHAQTAAGHTVRDGGGSAVVQRQYRDLTYALSDRRYASARTDASDALKSFVASHRDGEHRRFLNQFAARGGKMPATQTTAGNMPTPRTTSAFVEKVNHLNQQNDARTAVSPYLLLRKLVEDEVARLEKQKGKAASCTDSCPPGVRVMLKQLMVSVNDPKPNYVIEVAGERTFKYAIKASHAEPSRRAYRLVTCQGSPATWTCTCGLKAISGFPCECLAAVASKKMGIIDIAQLLDPEYTNAVWQQQMSFDFAATFPESIPSGPPSEMKAPVWLPKKAGRPKTKRIPSAGESSDSHKRRRVARSSGTSAPLPLDLGGGASSSSGTALVPSPVHAAPGRKQYMCGKCGKPRRGCGCKNRSSRLS